MMKGVIVSVKLLGDILYIGLNRRVSSKEAKEILILLDDKIQFKRWKFTPVANQIPERVFVYEKEKRKLTEINP